MKIFGDECSGADYVLVALGNDELNLQAAHWIKRKLDIINISARKNVPINYVIEDAELLNALISEQSENSGTGCILNPFGSLKEHYSLDNIKMTEPEKRAYSVNRAHSSWQSESKFLADEYGRNSSIASAMHLPYKLVSYFSSGEIKGLAENGIVTQSERIKEIVADEGRIKPLYWLEHRRWCAYQRINGMRCPTAKEFFALAFDENLAFTDHKRLDLFLHSCLVESGRGITSVRQMDESKFEKTKEEYIKEGKATAEDCSLEEWLNGKIVYRGKPGLDALDKLAYLTGKTFKDNDVNVLFTLCLDDYRRNILYVLGKLLDRKRAEEYVGLVEKFISLYKEIIKSYPPYSKQHDSISADNIDLYRLGIYKGFELAIVKGKDGTQLNTDEILNQLKKWLGTDDEQQSRREAFIGRRKAEKRAKFNYDEACQEWNGLFRLVYGCKEINGLKHTHPDEAFVIYIESEDESTKERSRRYALLGLPLIVDAEVKTEGQKGRDGSTQTSGGERISDGDNKVIEVISINFNLLSCAEAVSHEGSLGVQSEDKDG